MPVKLDNQIHYFIHTCTYKFQFIRHLQFGDDVNGENGVTAAGIVVHAVTQSDEKPTM
jgi:hypothetical protein